MKAILDNFSGPVSDLKPKYRNDNNVLNALSNNGRVSAFDMSEYTWLRNIIGSLQRRGLIVFDDKEPYPWCRYELTDAGIAELGKCSY